MLEYVKFRGIGSWMNTSYTDAALRRLAELKPRTMAVMHGSSFVDAAALQILAPSIQKTIGGRN